MHLLSLTAFFQDLFAKKIFALEKYFGKNFKGCELKRIGYSEEYTAVNASGYVEKYSGQDVIILESEFVASDNEELTDGKTYSGWKWIMGRSGSDDWEVLEYQKQ